MNVLNFVRVWFIQEDKGFILFVGLFCCCQIAENIKEIKHPFLGDQLRSIILQMSSLALNVKCSWFIKCKYTNNGKENEKGLETEE